MIYYQVFKGACHEVLKRLSTNPEERGKYRLVVTSPPYYGHRHYGNDPHEIGQEQTMKYLLKN
jgi:DNA modification methylase